MEDQNVTVDGGDLSEACQAANAWASQLRNRASLHRNSKAYGSATSDEDAADRIDQAVHRLREQSHKSLLSA